MWDLDPSWFHMDPLCCVGSNKDIGGYPRMVVSTSLFFSEANGMEPRLTLSMLSRSEIEIAKLLVFVPSHLSTSRFVDERCHIFQVRQPDISWVINPISPLTRIIDSDISNTLCVNWAINGGGQPLARSYSGPSPFCGARAARQILANCKDLTSTKPNIMVMVYILCILWMMMDMGWKLVWFLCVIIVVIAIHNFS